MITRSVALSLVIAAAFASLSAWAAPAPRVSLSCQAQEFLAFHATLDSSGYAEGSGYAEAIGASLIDNYSTAQLICYSQNKPGEFNCIGYWFQGIDEQVASVEVRRRESDGKQVARFKGYMHKAMNEALCETKAE